ncbi:MAG: TrmH family RNA methyltransferase [Bacillota bacterium]
MEISSSSNSKIKYLRSLYHKKYRREHQQFVLEGVRLIEEAIQEGASLEQVFYSDYLLRNERGEELLKNLEEQEISFYHIPDDLLQQVADTVSPQGILAVVDKINYNLEQVLLGQGKLILLVDQIQDPGNLGTIIRTADAAGVDAVITTKGTVSLYNQKTIRATMGSLFRTPIAKISDLDKFKDVIKKDFNVVVADVAGEQYHFEIDYLPSTIIIVGNEGQGPREELIDLADQIIKIPLRGGAESLNVAMATSVITYEAVRQKLDK